MKHQKRVETKQKKIYREKTQIFNKNWRSRNLGSKEAWRTSISGLNNPKNNYHQFSKVKLRLKNFLSNVTLRGGTFSITFSFKIQYIHTERRGREKNKGKIWGYTATHVAFPDVRTLDKCRPPGRVSSLLKHTLMWLAVAMATTVSILLYEFWMS